MDTLRIAIVSICLLSLTGCQLTNPNSTKATDARLESKSAQAGDNQEMPPGMSINPTPQHKAIMGWAGQWDLTFEFWGDPKSDKSMTWTTPVTRTVTKDGWFLEETYQHNMGNPAIPVSDNTHLYGFNPATGKMSAVLWGSGAGAMFIYEGKKEGKSGPWILHGGFDAPWGRISERYEVGEPNADGVQVMTLYGSGKMPDGTEVKNWKHMVLTYKRRQRDMDMEKHMAEWTKSMTPGEVHAGWKELVGDWDYTMSWSEPGQPEPMISKGKARLELKQDRYLYETASYEMMGMTVNSTGIMSYDNSSELFQYSYMSDSQTGQFIFEGKAVGDEIVSYGRTYDGVNKTWIKSKLVSPLEIEGDSYVVKLYFDFEDNGKWHETGVFTYTRPGK